jgi:DNA-binding NtrC family response regulator
VKVMAVEDDELVGTMIVRALARDGMTLEVQSGPASVLAELEAGHDDWDVVLLDVGLADTSGIDVLRRFQELGSLASVVMLTADDSAATATTCMRAGAFHYVTKPFENLELRSLVESAGRYSNVRRELADRNRRLDDEGSTLIGTSAVMRRLRETIARLATRDVSILLHGESGSGKELVARALHQQGPRGRKRFIALNCGAIPEALIDSELFGHTRGAFTGATADRTGVFVDADGGTLLLDEIGDMPMAVQVRLLRVLQEQELTPVGGTTVRKVDVRVIAATHVDLAAAVERGTFRQDLYYRLNVVKLEVPALRERLDDLPLIVAHLLKKHEGANAPALAPDVLERLMQHSWPGNVRELENALLHALALRHGDVIGIATLPDHIRKRGVAVPRAELAVPGEELTLTEAKHRSNDALERSYLARVMTRSRGSISQAARLAGLDRANFRRLLQRHGFEPASFK